VRKGHPGGAAVAVFAALNLLLPAQVLARPRIQPEEQYFVVGLRPSTDKPKAGDRLHGARVERVDRTLDFVRVSTRNPNVFRSRAKADPRVRYVEPDPELQLIEYTPNDPSFGDQYGAQHVRAPEVWDTTLGDLDASVCIVDSGVRYTHEEIAGSRWLGGHDFYNGDSDPNDDNGHGTHVATTAAGSIDNAKGIAGIANVGIFGVKVLSASGSGPWSAVASGIRWCADNGGPRVVISMSLGSGGTATVLEDAVKYAAGKGALQVAAAGNGGPCTNCVIFPARYPEVIAVTCTDSTKNQCSFSSDGPESELAGPGNGILAGWHTSDTAYNTISGTSMSTPHVSGAATLVWSHETALTAAELRQLLRDSAQDLGAAGWDELYGYGLVDTKTTLDAAGGPPPPPPPLETTLSLENFDDGAANGWALTGMWRVTSACTTAASLPNHLVYNKASDCKYSNGTKRTTGTATFDADLTGSSVATLKFNHRWETEIYLIGGFDVRRVLVSTDAGSTWSILQQWDSRYSNQLTWTAHSIDLDRFAGQAIKVRFFFDTVDGTSNGFAGWFLDDVEVTRDVNQSPVADAGPDQTVSDHDATGTETVTLDGTGSTDPDGTIASYEWKEGETVVGTTATPSVDLGVGAHTVTLTVTDDDGATASDDVVITVNANQDPTATFTVTTSAATADVDGSASSDPDGSIAAYTWDWGDGSPAGSGATDSHTYGASGTYTVTLTVADDGGATDVASQQVTVGKPVADAGPNQTVSDHDGTGSETVALDGTASTDSDGTIVSYEWKEGETVVGTGATPSVDFPVGVHTVTLTVTDNDGVTDSDNVLITVNANQDPTATFTATTTGLTADVDASASSDPDGSIAAYSWDWGDGSPTDSGATATHTYASPGTYTVTLTVTDDGGATDVVSQQVVTGNQSPVADAGPDQTVSDHDGTGSETVTLDGTASTDPDGTITSYEWREGETVVGTGATPSVAFGVGAHTVTLTVTDDDLATASDDVLITVNANQDPTATFTATTSGGTADVDASASTDPDGSITAYAWDWGDGSPAGSGALATHTYGASGTYTVTLTVTDDGGATDVASQQVTVGKPVADAGPNQTVSDNDGTGSETVTLDGSGSTDSDGTIVSYEWKEGESVVGTGPTLSVDFGVGAHTVTLTVTDNDGVTDSDNVLITVNANQDPTATFTATTSGLTANVDGSASSDPDGSIAGYTWDWGDGSPQDSGITATHTFASPGTYTVTLTVTDDGGATDVVSQQVTVSTTILSENFDSGAPSGWTITGMWHVSSLCATAPSAPNYLAYNKDSDCTYSNRTNRTSGVARFDVDLTGKSQATLEFTHRWETEKYSGGAFDVQRVQVSVDGGSKWITLKQWDSRNANQLEWTTYSQDLAQYTNRPIKLRFFFDTMDAISNSYPGWFIDDVRVTAS